MIQRTMTITLDPYMTLAAACLVLVVGRVLVARVAFLSAWSIPEAVAGGIVAATTTALLHACGVTIAFTPGLQGPLLLVFFSAIGLTADLAVWKRGGRLLVRFVAVVVGFLVIQNVVGIAMASVLRVHPAQGLIAGSITLGGGHGTGSAWAEVFAQRYGLHEALPLAMACATFGLVLGGIAGGPVARLLVHRLERQGKPIEGARLDAGESRELFAAPQQARQITPMILIETLLPMTITLAIGTMLQRSTADSALSLPDFVWVLFVAVVLGSAVRAVSNYRIEERAASVVGNTCVALFLALSMMTLRLWELVEKAGPLLLLLAVQTVVLIAYTCLVMFPAMGRNYDAAVMSAAQIGFGLGATPTAIANIQAVTHRYGPSPVAFLLVPIVSAFFLDFVNTLVVKAFVLLPRFN